MGGLWRQYSIDLESVRDILLLAAKSDDIDTIRDLIRVLAKGVRDLPNEAAAVLSKLWSRETSGQALMQLYTGELQHKVEMVFHDMETVDGRAEGAFHDVDEIPVTIVETNGRSVARWEGNVPNSKSVRLILEESVGTAT